ncbi:hypothetical protein F5Y16DRAFT_250969 [Xylariaceae sp. FL0255]|nr:hypothetical protein F5Y16DRAFT_250969 [Xylariaceae sp. FL0255]
MARTARKDTSSQNAAPDPPSSGSDEKRFACTHAGCKKRFTRAEHVQRHALNHTSGDFTCLECRAHFKREDLLKRHMNRHRQKELEADDPSTAVLNTRKRSWRTLEGEVVEKRPYLLRHRQLPSQQDSSPIQQRSSPGPSTSPQEGATDHQVPVNNGFTQPFPNVQGGSGAFDSHSHYPQQNEMLLSGTIPTQPLDFPNYNFEQIQYDQIFQPDTASSFNMPYTTSLDYLWLFSDPGQNTTQPMTDVNFIAPTQMPFAQPQPSGNVEYQKVSDLSTHFAITPESMDSLEHWGEMIESSLNASAASSSRGLDANPPLEPSPPRLPSTSLHSPNSASPLSSPVKEVSQKGIRPKRQKSVTNVEILAPEPEQPLSMLHLPLKLPEMKNTTRERLLKVIEAANPFIPKYQQPIRDHPLLSSSQLSSYLELYFTKFNSAYPLLHLATFDVNTVEPLLLLSVLLLGATYSSEDAHRLAVCVHDVIRPSIFAHAGFSARPQLWTLQTVLLVECFGKSRAGQEQHDMSHLFHGLLINLIRRSDCQSVQPSGPPNDVADPEALHLVWKRWSEAEERKRLALLCFMWDTQHAVLFCQSLCMSSFELRITLPCSQSVWEAPDASSWASAWRSSGSRDDKTSFLAALKSYLTHGLPRPAKLSSLSRILLLHGLMSVAWDMQRREQTSLGVVSGPRSTDTWRKPLSTAYDTWKSDFDAHFAAIESGLGAAENSDTNNIEQEMQVFTAAYNAVYHSAKALLNMDFLDIQIYGGSRHILGRPVQPKDYTRSKHVVKRWAANITGSNSNPDTTTSSCDMSATTAAWHSACLLSEVSEMLIKTEHIGLFHVPWCLYLATLTCWAAYHARPSGGSSFSDGEAALSDNDDIVWDPKDDMKKLITKMVDLGPRDPSICWQKGMTALVWVTAESLATVRWGIIRAGALVLRGLVPQRLINQYEKGS